MIFNIIRVVAWILVYVAIGLGGFTWGMSVQRMKQYKKESKMLTGMKKWFEGDHSLTEINGFNQSYDVVSAALWPAGPPEEKISRREFRRMKKLAKQLSKGR